MNPQLNVSVKGLSELQEYLDSNPSIACVASDIDYTLVDFEPGNIAGSRAIRDFLGDEIASESSRLFYLILEGFRRSADEIWDERDDFERLMRDLSRLEGRFSELYGLRVWSREAYLLLAAQAVGRVLTAKELEEARDRFFLAARDASRLYPDTLPFSAYLSRRSIPLLAMTGSDCILCVGPGCVLDYNPDFSREYKERRLGDIRSIAQDVFIGDPYDKPDGRFFDEMWTRALKLCPTLTGETLLVLGDSEKNDLEVPRSRGWNTCLIDRK